MTIVFEPKRYADKHRTDRPTITVLLQITLLVTLAFVNDAHSQQIAQKTLLSNADSCESVEFPYFNVQATFAIFVQDHNKKLQSEYLDFLSKCQDEVGSNVLKQKIAVASVYAADKDDPKAWQNFYEFAQQGNQFAEIHMLDSLLVSSNLSEETRSHAQSRLEELSSSGVLSARLVLLGYLEKSFRARAPISRPVKLAEWTDLMAAGIGPACYFFPAKFNKMQYKGRLAYRLDSQISVLVDDLLNKGHDECLLAKYSLCPFDLSSDCAGILERARSSTNAYVSNIAKIMFE